MMILWTNTLETGIGSIDDERKRLIEMANLFVDGDVIKQALTLSPKLLDGLMSLFKDYFDKEEDSMFRLDYPEADKHLLAHSVMLTSLEIAMIEYKQSGNANMIADFISENYVRHLKNEETSLASFIQKRRSDQAARAKKNKPGTKATPTPGAKLPKIPPRR